MLAHTWSAIDAANHIQSSSGRRSTIAALLIGYAGCSIDQQDPTAQRDGLAARGAANRVYVDRDLLGSNLSSLFKAVPPGSDLSDRQPLAPNPYCLRRVDLFGVDVGRFHPGVFVQDFDARSLGEVK
jgi:hypothetical protein